MTTTARLVGPLVAYGGLMPVVLRRAPVVRDRHTLARTHNLALALYSLVAFVGFAHHLVRVEGGAHVCRAPTRPIAPPWLPESWYWSKIWEWIDTLLLATRGKPVSTLHFYHHMITPSLVELQFFGRAGRHTPLYPLAVTMNAFAHTVMYAYYARPVASVRRWITAVQLTQHLVMVAALVWSVCASDCDRDTTGNWASLACYAFFAVEFGRIAAAPGRRGKAQ